MGGVGDAPIDGRFPQKKGSGGFTGKLGGSPPPLPIKAAGGDGGKNPQRGGGGGLELFVNPSELCRRGLK